MSNIPHSAGDLFRHVSAEKAQFYRLIMDTFASAKRQFRLQLRPDEVRLEAAWPDAAPPVEEIQLALSQLAEWGNLESQPDTARVSSIEDFYKARFLYRLSLGGEAVESALTTFAQALARRSELQTVALEDILTQLNALRTLAAAPALDPAKVHGVLRDLVRVFEGLADNAQAFMAGVARTIELQQADPHAVMTFKQRLIDYLQRFVSDLVGRSGAIVQRLNELAPHIEPLLALAAQRETRDAAPGDDAAQEQAFALRQDSWRERWRGLSRWFISDGHIQAQSEMLRAKARSAIPQLLAAVAALNERRSGRSDRSADFRILARWFADTDSDDDAHRLWRAGFALNPARHLSLISGPAGRPDPVPASTPWAQAPAVQIHPRLRERGEMTARGPLPHVREREAERAMLALQIAEERSQLEAARAALATGVPTRLSDLGRLEPQAFRLFLALLGEALAAQSSPEQAVARQSADGLLQIRLEPLAADSRASIATELGIFSGRDHLLTITSTMEPS
ncbi:TIGR02677 family protein [Massilia glaciei]|uniref:TIGR02677 family protein n=1 Tax=Massilia glaciei TaxID=1524097 RepID=A0A2U2HNT5_9BURK|nr:TIGR02677 family protein [Massilia glaciei]PWF49139.1 TIGR02677 family protein [Massilia glaciei]